MLPRLFNDRSPLRAVSDSQFLDDSGFSRFDDLLAGFFGVPHRSPVLNVWEGEKSVFVEAELPGFKANEIELSVLGNRLTIRGVTPSPTGEEDVEGSRAGQRPRDRRRAPFLRF